MDVDDDTEEVERVQDWTGRVRVFADSLDALAGDTPTDFCERALLAWQGIVGADQPPRDSVATLIMVRVAGALTQVMLQVALDSVDTPDVRDRMTRDSTQLAVKEALDAIASDSESWLSDGLPSVEDVQRGVADTNRIGSDAMATLGQRHAELEQAEQDAAKDPYGAVLGFYDPDRDADINFEKLCSFTEAEHKRYRDAHERLRKMIDSELLRHISDQSDAIMDVIIAILQDLKEDRVSLTDEDAWDERRRKVRSALISFTSALHSHKDQSIRAVRDKFGRKTPEEQAVFDAFNDLLTSSFEYRWLLEMRDALLHGDINGFKVEFTARLHGDPDANVFMDRNYMLKFCKEHRNKPWLNPNELQGLTSDPSVLDMIKALEPLMGLLQDKLDAVLYPDAAADANTVKELIGKFNGRQGLYALQNGPGFTHRTKLPPLQRLAPRVLSYAISTLTEPFGLAALRFRRPPYRVQPSVRPSHPH